MKPEILDSIIQTIGQTPLVALDRLCKGLNGRVLAKIEFYNPGLSIKDRIALKIIEDAENRGMLKPGSTVVELTSGNTGIGLSIVCAIKGYKMIALMSEGNSIERRRMLEAYGAKVVLVPQVGTKRPGQVSKEDLEAVDKKATELTKSLKAFRPDQFNNPSNMAAHELTGEEIWRQSGGKVDIFVTAVGTAGTLMGVSQALKKHNPNIKAYAVEPASAPFLAGKKIRSTSHKIQGAGYAMLPPLWKPELCDGFLTVTDSEAIRMARALGKREGICAGFSSGANVAAALKLAEKVPPKTVIVTTINDTGLKYLSTDLFD
jgi:cysteine synthase A